MVEEMPHNLAKFQIIMDSNVMIFQLIGKFNCSEILLQFCNSLTIHTLSFLPL